LRIPDAVQHKQSAVLHRWSGIFTKLGVGDDPGSAAHHFAMLVLRCAREAI
jgi:hypothetical protein